MVVSERDRSARGGTLHTPSREPVCIACGAAYDEIEWRSLHVAERIGAEEVRLHVRGWPDGLYVEVRHCGRCGRMIAAKREVCGP